MKSLMPQASSQQGYTSIDSERGNLEPERPPAYNVEEPVIPQQEIRTNDGPSREGSSAQPLGIRPEEISSRPKKVFWRVATIVFQFFGIWSLAVLLSYPHTTLVLQGEEHQQILDEYMRVSENYSLGCTRELSAMIPPNWNPEETMFDFYSGETCWKVKKKKEVCFKTAEDEITTGLIKSMGSQMAASSNDTDFFKAWTRTFDEAHAQAKNASIKETADSCPSKDYFKCSYNPSFFANHYSAKGDIYFLIILLTVELLLGGLEYLTELNETIMWLRGWALYISLWAARPVLNEEVDRSPAWLRHKFGHLIHSELRLSTMITMSMWLSMYWVLRVLLGKDSGMRK